MVTRIHMSSDYTEPLCEAMGWDHDLADQVESAKLAGLLTSGGCVLQPNKREMKSNEIQISHHEIRDFQLVVNQTEDGGKTAELRFVVVTAAKDAAAIMGMWFQQMGSSPENCAVLKVKHDAQGKLEEAPVKDEEGTLIIESGPVLPGIEKTGSGRKSKASVE